MYDIDKFYPIIHHLQSISPNMFKTINQHYMMFCPFCDDANRKAGNISHGHCYISKNYPVFYCQRCSVGGSILKLLLFTDFNNEEVINSLKQFINTNVIKDLYNFKKTNTKKQLDFKQCQEYIKKSYYDFEKTNIEGFDYFKTYLNSRIGIIDYFHFLIYPQYIIVNDINFLSVGFFNRNGTHSTSRILSNNSKLIRYKNTTHYFFQEKDFAKYTTIVLAEGPFDIIKLALYNIDFNFNNTFYLSINGKNYLAMLEELILEYLLIGQYVIHLIFDDDVYNAKSYIYKCGKLAEMYNNQIIINGWKPDSNFSDTGEFPLIYQL